jgi:hypothetical protein
MVTSVTQGRDTEIAQAKDFKIVGTYWHNHSLESSWGALSDGTGTSTIKFLINHFRWKNAFLKFSQKNLLKEDMS